MRYLLLLVFILCFLRVPAQFVEDFGDGDLTQDPPWVGDLDKFIVHEGVLRLFDDDAGQAWLSTQSFVMDNTQWDFWVRLAFTPSDNNHARIYLASDQASLTGPLNGYFLQIGRTGGDMKRLFLCRQDGTETTTLMTGNTNLAEGSNNILRIRVVRDGKGHWTVCADASGGFLFVPQGEATDNTHRQASWFGIQCTYTVSNSNRMYFDDIRVGAILPDAPLQVDAITVESGSSLGVVFNRVVDTQTAETPANYLVDQGIGHPMVAAKDPLFPNRVRLLFPTNFVPNHLYGMDIAGVTTPAGEEMEPYFGKFVHYLPSRFDVVFNEIMANSRPVAGLPPHDWIELYNTTGLPLHLRGWELQHGTTRRALPDLHLPPSGYLVLTTEEGYHPLEQYGNVVAVGGLPANAFTIGGTDLMLWDNDDQLIAFVSYSDRWYRDEVKAGGGWSLEKIDPYNFCQGAENWKASRDARGGTPATTNSVRGANPNTTSPRIVRTGYSDSLTVRLHFSEPMAAAELCEPGHYKVDHGIGHPVSVTTFRHDFTGVELRLAHPLQKNTFYTLTASEHLTDCDGNPLLHKEARLAIPSPTRRNDIVINEIMFNPPAGGARYVELLNRSSVATDLRDLMLCAADTLAQVLITARHLSEESTLFFPGDYLVLTADSGRVKQHHKTLRPDAFLELEGMPRMTNTDGVLALATRGHQVVDQVAYSEEMHLPLLTTFRGVALERIHPDRPSLERDTWHSAAAAAGHGTPGYRNSQYVEGPGQIRASFEVLPKVFSPDATGVDDVTTVYYQMEEPGFVANVRIFDRRGRMVRTLARGKAMATSGAFTWDGTTDSRDRAPVGIYVIHIELFNAGGVVSAHRKTVVVATRL